MSDEELLTPRERAALARNPDAELASSPMTDDEIATHKAIGVGGILGFLVLVLMLFSPLVGLVLTYSEHQMLQSNEPAIIESSIWNSIVIVDWATVAISSALSFLAGWLLLKRHVKTTVWLVISLIWISSVGVASASLIVLDNLMPNTIGASDAGGALGRPIVFSVIWTLYLLISKRVKRTYS